MRGELLQLSRTIFPATSLPSFFAAGDVTTWGSEQVRIAIGDGVSAATSAPAAAAARTASPGFATGVTEVLDRSASVLPSKRT